MSSNTRKPVEDATTLFDRWTYDNIDDDARGFVSSENGTVVYTDEIPEIKDGNKTGNMITKTFIYVKVGKSIKPATASKGFIAEMANKHGSAISKWVGKPVKFQHKKFGSTNYVELKA